MDTEFEATFWPIDKDVIRSKLELVDATRIHEERLMRRYVYYLPPTSPLKKAWARIRDEGDKITMSIKQSGELIEEQKELQIEVSDFETGAEMLRLMGLEEKAYQETKRELWELDGVDITIDEWPFLKPFVEVEGKSEQEVKSVSLALGFMWEDAEFCSIDVLYTKQYGITTEDINNRAPRLTFDGPNVLAELSLRKAGEL